MTVHFVWAISSQRFGMTGKNTKRADPSGIIGAPQFRQRLPNRIGPIVF
jgi:hypothetical protein